MFVARDSPQEHSRVSVQRCSLSRSLALRKFTTRDFEMDGWAERGRPAVREALDHVWEVIDRELQVGMLVLSPS